MPDIAAEVFAWIAGIAGSGILARALYKIARKIDDVLETVAELQPNGGLSNEILVQEGLALARRYEPDTAHAVTLEAAQVRAETAQFGMWAPDACGTASTALLAIGTISFDAEGNDNLDLNDVWVQITNVGTDDADLTGWVVKDESATHRYNFPSGFELGAGSTVTIYTGCGTDNTADLYWCNTGSAVWNNSGDTAFLLDPAGNIIDSKSY